MNEIAMNDPRLSTIKRKIEGSHKKILHMKKDGDVFRYLQRFLETDPKTQETHDMLERLGHETYEDLIQNSVFLSQFDLHEHTTTNDLVYGELYDSLDIAVVANNYNVMKGMYLINENGIEKLIVKATVDDPTSAYMNTWITEDTLKYYLETNKNVYDGRQLGKIVNRKLIFSWKNETDLPIHLFTRKEKGTPYKYHGVYRCLNVVDNTYVELTTNSILQPINPVLEETKEEHVIRIKREAPTEFEERAKQGNEHPCEMYSLVKNKKRDPYVKRYVKDRAEGKCELCGKQAPFTTTKNEPYLEVHHLITLSEDGPDTIYNSVALCPNCHRMMHYGCIDTESPEYQRLTQLIVQSLNDEPELLHKAIDFHDISKDVTS
jgi:5-methylcytosine-specific restriction protein A